MSATAQAEFNELMRDKHHRTTHPEDDARSFLNLSDDDDDDDDLSPPAPEATLRPSMSSLRSTTIPRTRYGANTGPKGVISDAQHFRDSRRQHHRTSVNGTHGLAGHVNGLSLKEARPVVEERGDEEELLEEDEEDDMDDDFMRRWRASRLQQLQGGAGRVTCRAVGVGGGRACMGR